MKDLMKMEALKKQSKSPDSRNGIFDNKILLIDKPSGITSFTAIKQVKRLIGVKKIGHSGTLDRSASGLLVVCTGQATRLTRYFLADNKRYTATVHLGVKTDTDDGDGAVVETRPVRGITEEKILSAAGKFRGRIQQAPPVFSALKIQGRRASDRARSGEDVHLAEREVTVHRLDVSAFDLEKNSFDIEVECSKGTYIRSIARDMGDELGTGAYCSRLQRNGSGIFNREDSTSLDELADYIQGEGITPDFIRNPSEALGNYSSFSVEEGARARILNGAVFEREDIIDMREKEGEIHIIYDKKENIIAIADIDIQKWHIKYLNVFRDSVVL